MNTLSRLSRHAFEAYDFLTVPVWVFSLETHKILVANQASLKWLGYDQKALLQMTVLQLRPVTEQARLLQRIREFDTECTDAGIWTIVTSSGGLFQADFSWRKVQFEGQVAVVASIRDMTQVVQREEIERSLKSNLDSLRVRMNLHQEHFRRLFEAVPGKILVVVPVNDVIVGVTDEYAKAVGRTRDELIGRPLFEVFPDDPDDPDADGTRNLRASLDRVRALRVTDVMSLQRYPVMKADGRFEQRYWLALNKPVLDDAGEILYIIHRVEDVTTLLKLSGSSPVNSADFDYSVSSSLGMEDRSGAGDTTRMSGAVESTDPIRPVFEMADSLAALQTREARLRAAEILLELGAWEFDPETEKFSWSARVFDIYGWPVEGLPGNLDDYVAIVHPDDRDQMLATYQQFKRENAQNLVFEHRVTRADGELAHVRGVGVRHMVEGRQIILGYVQDVTQIKKVEHQLIEASRLQRRAGLMARLGTWRLDLNPPRISWSPETAQIHDEPEGVSPSLEDAINYYKPEYQDLMTSLVDACISQGRPFDELLQLVTAKGRSVWVRAIGEPVYGAQNKIVAAEGAFQDISELIAARDLNEDLSTRLRQTLERISDAFFLLDDQWRFTFLNNRAEVVLSRRREDLLGRRVWDEFPAAVGTTFQTEYERAVREQTTVRFVSFYPTLAMWFEVAAYPTAEGLAVYFRDVTQQRSRDEHLLLLESAVSRQNDILVITSAQPINAPAGPEIVYVNDAFVRRTGFSREEAIGKTPRILQGPLTQRDELDRIRQALEAWQPVRAELINYTKTGEEFWLEIDIVPLADSCGRFTHWVAIERDITDRKLAQQVLQLSEERFRLVARATGNAVWEMDVETGNHWWSDGLTEIFGHKPQTLQEVREVWDANIHAEDRDRVQASLAALLSQEADSVTEQYRFRRADGTWAQVQDNAFVVRGESGKPLRLLGTVNDISERLQLEKRLYQAQKMEAVGQLTGGVAHDFNNLLTVILGNAEVLAKVLGYSPRLHSSASMIVDAAVRGAELTNRLLAFSRRQPLEPSSVNVRSLIQGMEDLFRRTLPETINIEIVCGGGLWNAEVDPAQLESALLNLILNARDAMPGGGCLTIEAVNAQLDDDYVASELDIAAGQYVMIIVTDTGHGISGEHLGRIFEPFFTTKTDGKGTGMGLSMVFGFVKQSGGHIRVYSEVSEGTSFKLYFPRSYRRSYPASAKHAQQIMARGCETILLVEDDELVRSHVLAQLKSLGYQVLEAPDGPSAFEILKLRTDIDLLFTDVVMPGGMSGKELAQIAQSMMPGLKVLFTSGYTQNSIVHNGRLDPGVELLSKPYRRDQLASKIRSVLDG